MPKKKKVDQNDLAYPGSVSQLPIERRSSARLAKKASKANRSPLTPLPTTSNQNPPRKQRQTKKKLPVSNAIVTDAEVPSHPNEITSKAPPTQTEDGPPSPPNAPVTLAKTQEMNQDPPGHPEDRVQRICTYSSKNENLFNVSQLDISSELRNLASSTPLPKRSLPKRNDAQHSHSVPNHSLRNQSLQKRSDAQHNHSVPNQSLRKRNDAQHNDFDTHHSQIPATSENSKAQPPPSNSCVSIERSDKRGIEQTTGHPYTFIPANSHLPFGDSNAFAAIWNPRHQTATFQTPVCMLENLAEYSSSASSCEEDNASDRDTAENAPPVKDLVEDNPSKCRVHVESGEFLGFSESEYPGTEVEYSRKADGEEEALKKFVPRYEAEVDEDGDGDGFEEREATQFEVAQKALTKDSTGVSEPKQLPSRSNGTSRPQNQDPNATCVRYWMGGIAHIDLNSVPQAGKGTAVGKAKYVASDNQWLSRNNRWVVEANRTEGADDSDDDHPQGENVNMMEVDDDRGRGDDFDADAMAIDKEQHDEGDLPQERPATPAQAQGGNKSQIGTRRSPRRHPKVQTLVTDLMSGERLFLTEQELILAVTELRRRIKVGGPSRKLYKRKMDFLMSVPAVAKVIAKSSLSNEETEPARGQKQGKSGPKEKQKKHEGNKKLQSSTKSVDAIATQTKAPAPQVSGDRPEKLKRKSGVPGKASIPSGKKVAKVKAPGNECPARADRPQNQKKTADFAKNVSQATELRRPSRTYVTDSDSGSASDQEDVDIVHEHLAKKGVKPMKWATSKQNDKGGVPKRVAQPIPPSQPVAKTSSKPSKEGSSTLAKKKTRGKTSKVPDAGTEAARKRHATATTAHGHGKKSNHEVEDTRRREHRELGRFLPVHPDDLFNVQDNLGPFGQSLPGKHNRRPEQIPTRKRAREEDDVDDVQNDDDSDAVAALCSRTKTKRRKKTHNKHKVADEKTKKTSTQSEGESFDINEGESRTKNKSLTRSKKGIKGEDKDLLDLALFYERIYFFAVNGFPDPEEITFWSTNAYTVSCKSLFRGDWKENMDRRFNKNIQYLLQREAWIVRNKVKRLTNKMIGRFYSFHPRRNAFAQYPNAKAQEKAYIKGKIRKLLGRDALFMCGRLKPNGPLIPFANKAIEELIVLLVFDKSTSRRPLAMRSYDTFDPIPLPLIAYAVVALLYGLEEFKTGVQTARDFSSKSYEDYYKSVLCNLREMEEDEEFSPLLEQIRARILKSGRDALYGNGGVEDDRPPMPFVPSHRRVPPTGQHQAPMDREDADESEVEVDEDSDVGSTGDDVGCEEDDAMDQSDEGEDVSYESDEGEDVSYESDEGEDAVDRSEDGDTIYESDDFSEEE
ncbi:hypothetical protein SCHPADRAFT_888871 [Schizopora paradoxa]|uniref:DUF6532 domain-containing protein n=1 Tax=Schizopora paradoxa TaxID=27342 RepID=A0A0H2RT46_9AGAM|nr:hypothetical protein SCHPADRAFT_888871 [Schizopora paradoxa]